MGLGHADGQLVKTQPGVELDLGLGLRQVLHPIGSVDLGANDFDFLLDGGLERIEQPEVARLAGLTFGWERALYALITLFVWGVAADFILEGPSVVRMAFIVTDAPDPVAQALLTQLGLGVTAWSARGKFSEATHTVLFCTVSRPEVDALRSLVAEIDPEAFVVIGHGHQASGGMVGQRPPP